MTLSTLLAGIKTLSITGDASVDISHVALDSRQVSRGGLFVAMRGTQLDGHRFIDAVLAQGAVAIVCEEVGEWAHNTTATIVQVPDTAQAVGPLATAFHGYPSRRLSLVGVTGTNGKTTIATLLYNMFRQWGHRCGLISTVCNYIDGRAIPATHTTPDAIALNDLLAQMVEAQCEYVFMECSSHAIAQHRIGGLTFRGGIFTNLTRDHLDFHKTFENYRDAKKLFFDSLDRNAFAITNADDKNGLFMTQNTRAQVLTYSTQRMADYRARILECHFEGMYLDIDGQEVGVQFIGRFNVSNLLAVYACACQLGRQRDEILLAMSTLHSVSGRLQPVYAPDGRVAVVDYAHTPDALANVLAALHDVQNGKGRIITVCGAGGNRDAGKRPLMAQQAAAGSHIVILTSDNPRYEDPQTIIDEMAAGLTPAQKKKTLSIVDRREAIRTACTMAQKGDVVLVAGKGHEDYQEIQGVKHHFNDSEVLKEVFTQ
ncbi:MAG: UDP-N-acetylmuramoyl-L-alanyl-D-glutamate--2,6-diaminopimelate ligase [Bacteroidaceae bacterium]|nr:UDP-N-acetylmuramoyl-L-alanyl-D-glutamate--2,6-diaminopimelate ligase [Bacteroidaceae bacterium]